MSELSSSQAAGAEATAAKDGMGRTVLHYAAAKVCGDYPFKVLFP
jgi:hypothetical protein